MLKVTTRYLASNFIPPFAIGFVFFVAFLITFYMFRIISLIVNKGVELSVILNMVSNLSVSFFPLATPLSVFFATIYTLNKLSEDSEIIAMRSFGITKFRIYLPFLVSSVLIAVTIFSLNSVYIPKANANFKNTIVKLTSTGMLTSIKSGQFFTDIPKVTLFADNVSEDGNSFNKVFLHVKENEKEERIIFANNGSLIKLFADDFHAPSLRLHLNDGNIVKINEQGEKVEKILFKEYDFPIFSAEFGESLLDKDSMKTSAELKVVNVVRKEEYEKLIASDPTKKDKIKELRKTWVKGQIEYYARIVSLPQIILFALLGFSLGIKRGRGAAGNSSIQAILVLLGYYAVYFLLISMAQRGGVSPLIATFLPSFLLFFISIYFYRKLDWVG